MKVECSIKHGNYTTCTMTAFLLSFLSDTSGTRRAVYKSFIIKFELKYQYWHELAHSVICVFCMIHLIEQTAIVFYMIYLIQQTATTTTTRLETAAIIM